MKRDIAYFVAMCFSRWRYIIKTQRYDSRNWYSYFILEVINMEFLMVWPWVRRKNDSNWVIVDSITNSVHFLDVETTCLEEDYTNIYINDIVMFYGVPLPIIYIYIGLQFTCRLIMSFQKGLGTQVNLNKMFQKQRDGKEERTIYTLEDMLMDFVIEFKGSWYDHLYLIEFASNSSYHSCIQIASYETIYWYRWTSPIGLFEVCEKTCIWPNSV